MIVLGRIIAPSSLWLLLALAGAAQAETDKPTVAHIGALTGQDPLLAEMPYKFAEPRYRAVAMYERLRAWRGDAVYSLDDAPTSPQLTQQIVTANSGAKSWGSSDPVVAPVALRSSIDGLAGASRLQPIGNGKALPFEKLPEVFLRRNAPDSDQIVSVAIGWIRWSSFRTSSSDGIHDKGGCDPSYDWPDFQCLERIGDDSYVIKMKPGHKGWSIYAAGSALAGVKDRKANALPTGNVKAYFEWLGGISASDALRDFFVIVPNKSVRDRRTVRFEFYLPDRSEPISSPVGADPLPREDHVADNGKQRNVCGVSAACPNYFVPPERASEVNRALDRAGIR